MTVPTMKEQIINELDRLSPQQQVRVLEIARSLARPRGVPARSLLKYAGRIAADDLEEMEQAIADFERIDPDEW